MHSSFMVHILPPWCLVDRSADVVTKGVAYSLWHRSCQRAKLPSSKSSLTTRLSEPADDISRQGEVWDTGPCEPEDLELTQVRQLIPEWEEGWFIECQVAWLCLTCPTLMGPPLKQKLNLDSPEFKVLWFIGRKPIFILDIWSHRG